MKKLLATIVIGLCVLGTVGMVNAAIVDMDDVGGVGYFKDTQTNLTYMDVDNFLNMKFSDIKDSVNGTGFHVANLEEMNALKNNLLDSFGNLKQDMNDLWAYMGGAVYSDNILRLNGFIDYTGPATTTLWTIYDNSFGIFAGAGLDYSDPGVGAFVVQDASPVPIPGAILLLGSGIIGLGGFRRKFKK